MEKNKLNNYQAPQIEVLEVEVEQGFATSGEGQGGLNNFGWGGEA